MFRHSYRTIHIALTLDPCANDRQDAVCTYRAKLFVYGETLLNKGTGNKEWKERGVGEIKVLRHKDHGRLRVLMRQDKTMKVIANHPLDPSINLQPNVGSDRSWLWTTDDYSEGEYVETTFACRFQDTDKANEFKEQFLALQKEMETILQGKDKPGDATAADEAAQALSALKTGEDAEEDDDDDDDVDV